MWSPSPRSRRAAPIPWRGAIATQCAIVLFFLPWTVSSRGGSPMAGVERVGPAPGPRRLAETAVAPGARKVHVFYNVFAPPGEKWTRALPIVEEQLTALRAAPLWPFVAEIRFATLGAESIATAVAERCAALGATCVHLGHADAGSEGASLMPLHQFCATEPGAAVAYIHDKGSFHDTPQNRILRAVLLRGLASRPCADAIVGGQAACDVCSMRSRQCRNQTFRGRWFVGGAGFAHKLVRHRFSPIPHQHTPGNMWLARCDYVARLREPHDFKNRMMSHWHGGGAAVGTGRFAFEHWVHSHPTVRPCDVLDHQYPAASTLPPCSVVTTAPRRQRDRPAAATRLPGDERSP